MVLAGQNRVLWILTAAILSLLLLRADAFAIEWKRSNDIEFWTYPFFDVKDNSPHKALPGYRFNFLEDFSPEQYRVIFTETCEKKFSGACEPATLAGMETGEEEAATVNSHIVYRIPKGAMDANHRRVASGLTVGVLDIPWKMRLNQSYDMAFNQTWGVFAGWNQNWFMFHSVLIATVGTIVNTPGGYSFGLGLAKPVEFDLRGGPQIELGMFIGVDHVDWPNQGDIVWLSFGVGLGWAFFQ